MVALSEPEKSSGDYRFVEVFRGMPPGMRQQIACDVLGHKLVVRHICVQRSDDVIAISPDVMNGIIELMSQGFGITNQVQPMSGPTFAKARRCQQSIYLLFVSIRRSVPH